MSKIASLCVLAYKRPQQLIDCFKSLEETIDYPCEIIVNEEGGSSNHSLLFERWKQGKISKLVLNRGGNRGVGRSFQNCLGMAEGDYIFKLDADLTFHKGWLSTAVKILDTNPEVGALGLFDYHKWDSNDPRFKPEENVINTMKAWDFEYSIVKDFVSSAYCFRTQDYKNIRIKKSSDTEYQVTDDGLHLEFGKLALKDCVDNTAFGVTKSTYVSGTEDHPFKTPTFAEPLLFGTK